MTHNERRASRLQYRKSFETVECSGYTMVICNLFTRGCQIAQGKATVPSEQVDSKELARAADNALGRAIDNALS